MGLSNWSHIRNHNYLSGRRNMCLASLLFGIFSSRSLYRHHFLFLPERLLRTSAANELRFTRVHVYTVCMYSIKTPMINVINVIGITLRRIELNGATRKRRWWVCRGETIHVTENLPLLKESANEWRHTTSYLQCHP